MVSKKTIERKEKIHYKKKFPMYKIFGILYNDNALLKRQGERAEIEYYISSISSQMSADIKCEEDKR